MNEKESLYDLIQWNRIDDWVKYIMISDQGTVFFCSAKPIQKNGIYFPSPNTRVDEVGGLSFMSNTVIERPKEI